MDETVRLPGFRFKPTEDELLSFYLKNMVNGEKMHLGIIGLLNIYQHSPWDLPGLAKHGEREWYFFVPRDRKRSNGGRPNRTTEHGFWKATGSDRKIVSLSEPKRVIGLRKTLVFYTGRAPRGSKTDWVMNEYRLPDACVSHKDIVLCKIYRKATSLKELELRAAKEEAAENKSTIVASYPTSPLSSSTGPGGPFSAGSGLSEDFVPTRSHDNDGHIVTFKDEMGEEKLEENNVVCEVGVGSKNAIQLPFGKESLGELQVPKLGLDWAQDPFSCQSCSPWLENLLNTFSSPTLLSHFLST